MQSAIDDDSILAAAITLLSQRPPDYEADHRHLRAGTVQNRPYTNWLNTIYVDMRYMARSKSSPTFKQHLLELRERVAPLVRRAGSNNGIKQIIGLVPDELYAYHLELKREFTRWLSMEGVDVKCQLKI